MAHPFGALATQMYNEVLSEANPEQAPVIGMVLLRCSPPTCCCAFSARATSR
jgi:hypothetical protein